MTKVALVAGGSSGISLLLARNQFATYTSMRNLKKGDELLKIATNERIPLKVIQLDVDDDANMFRVMSGLPSVEWGLQKEIDYNEFQLSEERTGYRKAKQKTLLDYTSN